MSDVALHGPGGPASRPIQVRICQRRSASLPEHSTKLAAQPASQEDTAAAQQSAGRGCAPLPTVQRRSGQARPPAQARQAGADQEGGAKRPPPAAAPRPTPLRQRRPIIRSAHPAPAASPTPLRRHAADRHGGAATDHPRAELVHASWTRCAMCRASRSAPAKAAPRATCPTSADSIPATTSSAMASGIRAGTRATASPSTASRC